MEGGLRSLHLCMIGRDLSANSNGEKDASEVVAIGIPQLPQPPSPPIHISPPLSPSPLSRFCLCRKEMPGGYRDCSKMDCYATVNVPHRRYVHGCNRFLLCLIGSGHFPVFPISVRDSRPTRSASVPIKLFRPG